MRKPLRSDIHRLIDRGTEFGLDSAEIAKLCRVSKKRIDYLKSEHAAKKVEIEYI